MSFLTETFTGANFSFLDAKPGWFNPSHSFQISSNRVLNGGGGARWAYNSASPANANYSVQVDSVWQTVANGFLGPAVRMDTSTGSCYVAWYSTTNSRWELNFINASGTVSLLGSFVGDAPTAAGTKVIKLEAIGTAIKVYIGGFQRISVTDSSLTSAGKVGLYANNSQSSTVGPSLDNLAADDAGPATVTGAAAVAGAGAVSATGIRIRFGVGAVAGTGTISASVTHTVFGAGSIAGAGTISASAIRKAIAAAAVPGTGAVSATAIRKVLAVASILGGSPALYPGGYPSTSVFPGAGDSIVASAVRTAIAHAAVQGTGGVNSSGGVTHLSAAAISGQGAIAGSGRGEVLAAASVSGAGAISASGVRVWLAAAALSGTGQITAAAISTHRLLGTATLTEQAARALAEDVAEYPVLQESRGGMATVGEER